MALANASELGFDESNGFPDKAAAPVVSNTHWGYVIRPSEMVMARSALFEMAILFVGVLLYLFAVGQWLIPGSIMLETVVPLKIALTAISMVIGLFMIRSGRHGLVRELQLDWVKTELRFVMRNRQGVGRLTRKMPFTEVARVLVRHGSGPAREARLELHLSGGTESVQVLKGDVADISKISEMLQKDIFGGKKSPRDA